MIFNVSGEDTRYMKKIVNLSMRCPVRTLSRATIGGIQGVCKGKQKENMNMIRILTARTAKWEKGSLPWPCCYSCKDFADIMEGFVREDFGVEIIEL